MDRPAIQREFSSKGGGALGHLILHHVGSCVEATGKDITGKVFLYQLVGGTSLVSGKLDPLIDFLPLREKRFEANQSPAAQLQEHQLITIGQRDVQACPF